LAKITRKKSIDPGQKFETTIKKDLTVPKIRDCEV